MKEQDSTGLSDSERKQAVRNFIVSSYHNQIHIRTYHRLAMFLTDDRIVLLCPLKKSGKENYYEDSQYKTKYWYTDEDAEKYFEWLIAVVNGTENAKVDVEKQAYDQLFRLLYVMREDMQRDKNVELIAPYDWQKLFHSFDMELVDIMNTVDRHDKDIVKILTSILELLKKNATLLEAIQKDYEVYFPPEGKTP